jgi:hypothetical protein
MDERQNLLAGGASGGEFGLAILAAGLLMAWMIDKHVSDDVLFSMR